MKKMLIAYASMAGSTAEVADATGNVINQADIKTDLLPVGAVIE